LEPGKKFHRLTRDEGVGFEMPFDHADPCSDTPSAIATFEPVDVASTVDCGVVFRFPVGAHEEVVGLRVGLVAVDVCTVVE
jgi:hypothetical protein